jgi:hypothetical protein
VAARFASNLAVLVVGCFLAAVTFAFPAVVIGWLGLASGCAIALTVLVAFASRGRGIVQRALDCVLALLAAWMIVASRSFTGDTLKWLTFASATTAALLAIEGLIAHEVVMEVSLRRAAARERAHASAPPAVPADQPPAIRAAG